MLATQTQAIQTEQTFDVFSHLKIAASQLGSANTARRRRQSSDTEPMDLPPVLPAKPVPVAGTFQQDGTFCFELSHSEQQVYTGSWSEPEARAVRIGLSTPHRTNPLDCTGNVVAMVSAFVCRNPQANPADNKWEQILSGCITDILGATYFQSAEIPAQSLYRVLFQPVPSANTSGHFAKILTV